MSVFNNIITFTVKLTITFLIVIYKLNMIHLKTKSLVNIRCNKIFFTEFLNCLVSMLQYLFNNLYFFK